MPSIAGFFWPVNFLIKHFGQKAFRAVEEEPGTEQRWSYTASNAVATSPESAPVAAPTAKTIKTVLCHRKQPPRTTVSICSSSCCPLASLDWDELRSLSVDAAFVTLTKDRPDAFLVPADTFLASQRGRIAQFAIENKLPSAYTFREYIEAGGLLAYTPNYKDLFRRAASYVDKILKGAKPGELPIQQPRGFHLSINLKTARALGLTVPRGLLAGADEVLE